MAGFNAAGGGGGSAQGVKAGRAFVEAYLKDDQLQAGLKRVEVRAKTMGDIFKKAVGLSGEFGVGLGIAGLARITFDATSNLARLNSELEESRRLSAEAAAQQERLGDRFFESVGGRMPRPIEMVPEGQRLDAVHKELDRTARDLEQVGKLADKAREKVQELSGGWNMVVQRIPFAGDALEAEREIAKQEQQILADKRKFLAEYLKALRDTAAGMMPIQQKLQLDWMKSITEIQKELKLQLGTIGMTPEEAIIFKLETTGTEKGLKNVQQNLQSIRELVKEIGQAQNWMKLRDEGRAFAQEMEDALRFAGKTADEIRMIRLMEAKGGPGVDPNWRGLVEMKKALEAMDAEKLEKARKAQEAINRTPTPQGQFGGQNAKEAFGIGDKGFFKEQLIEAKKVNENLGKVERAIKELDGVAFA